MTYSVTQDNELSEQIIEEMKACVAYYKKYKYDMVDFTAKFNEDTTYIEKLKVTLYSKFPRKQNDHEFWNFVREQLGMELESEFTPPRWAPSPQHNIEPPAEPKEIIDDAGHDLTAKSDAKQLKDDKLLIRTLQEQLSLPSGLNMNPSPISSTLLPNVTNSMSSNNSIQTTSSSPRDSPITIPSNSASPAKFEIPVRASPSPVKSDTSSTRTRNSPAPSPNHKYSVDRTDLTRSSPSANIHKYEQVTHPSTSAPSTQPSMSSLSDFYSANFSNLAKNLSSYSPSDYAMLFNSKDYGLSSLNQLASSASTSSSTKQQQSQSSTSTSSSSSATATANNMKDFLAQLEKTTELSYLMQSQYNYPGLGGASKASNDYHSSKSSTKHEKSKSSRASSAQQQQQQHQRQLEEDYKRDANNISEFMRSQEYATLLMEQAEALSKSYQMPEMPKKSKKSQQQQHQQHVPSAADLTSLLQASPKIHELNSLFQTGKQTSDLTSLLQQQLSAATASTPSTSSSQKKNQNQQPDYSSLFAHSKMADLTSLMAAGQSERDRHVTPSAAELSALFGSALGGKSSVDMLGSLLQSSKASDLSSLLFSQANAAELSSLFSQAASSSSSKTAANTAAYYTQAAIDKAQQDMATLYQQHGKYSSIPDPLSKSTLAANNMFMNPSAVYAKMQQEALNAMIMKPPKVSSSPSTTSSSKSREASASPALDKSHRRDSPASLNKYNFSAADLAISAVPNVPNAMSSPIIPSDHARKLSEFSQMDISMSEASQLESRLKKRMEFSSIADLVSTPSKMQKLEELANMHNMQDSESDSAALNLSSND